MTIANNERHNIAAKLRDLDEAVLDCREHEHRAICTVVGCWSGQEYAEMELKDRLADLIEPEPERTCELEPPISGKKRCKRCGAFVSYNAVWDCFGIIPARFCPNCGAKVVK